MQAHSQKWKCLFWHDIGILSYTLLKMLSNSFNISKFSETQEHKLTRNCHFLEAVARLETCEQNPKYRRADMHYSPKSIPSFPNAMKRWEKKMPRHKGETASTKNTHCRSGENEQDATRSKGISCVWGCEWNARLCVTIASSVGIGNFCNGLSFLFTMYASWTISRRGGCLCMHYYIVNTYTLQTHQSKIN